MRDLTRHVDEQQAAQWERLAIELGLKHYHIANIADDNKQKLDNPKRSVTCCRVLLQKWLDIDPSATWSKLDDAIKVIKQPSAINPMSNDKVGTYVTIVTIIYRTKLLLSLKTGSLQWKVDALLFKTRCYVHNISII